MANLGRREILLLVIGLDKSGTAKDSISGITRLQKYIFLLENESKITPENEGFEFSAYKAGPYSSRLYDDLELLENLGLIQMETAAEPTATEIADIDQLTFGDLINGDLDEDESRASDAFQARRFQLTEKGKKRIKSSLNKDNAKKTVDGIRRIKSKYSTFSLRDLLKHIYTKYPGMTTESEIIDDILGNCRT